MCYLNRFLQLCGCEIQLWKGTESSLLQTGARPAWLPGANKCTIVSRALLQSSLQPTFLFFLCFCLLILSFTFFFCQFWVFPCYVLFWVHIFPGVAAIAFAWIWSSSISWRTPAKIAFSRKWLHSNFKTFKIVFGKTLLLETIIEVLEIYIMLISTWIWKYYHKVYIHF